MQIPGGWGASGQPNDGFHQFIHLLNKAYCKAAVSWNDNILLRKRLDEISLSPQGSLSTKYFGSHSNLFYPPPSWTFYYYCTVLPIDQHHKHQAHCQHHEQLELEWSSGQHLLVLHIRSLPQIGHGTWILGHPSWWHWKLMPIPWMPSIDLRSLYWTWILNTRSLSFHHFCSDTFWSWMSFYLLIGL